MVKIIGTQKRTSEDGKEFNVLILQGGIEAVKSKTTGRNYITARKANMICTFSEEEAKELIGTKLPGTIIKQKCDPYEYSIPQTGEKIHLDYTFVYDENPVGIEENVFENAGELV